MDTTHDETWIFAPQAAAGAAIDLDPAESAHLVRVLRLREGTLCTAIDGRGGVFEVRLETMDPRGCRVACGALLRRDPPPPRQLAQAILKNRGMEDVLDLCAQTPLGAFRPLWSDHVQVPRGRDIDHQIERLRAKAVAAIKQSKQSWLCEILPPMEFDAWIESVGPGAAVCEVGGEEGPVPDASWIAIGPEGGFSSRELDISRARGARAVSLGPTRLRATAAGFWALARL